MDIDRWMGRAVAALDAEFGERLLVVGLQGSMRRGEATPESDIDILIVLDRLDAADLRRCRAVLGALPDGHRAHGFTSGRAELAAWPRSEMFAFARDVRCYRGELAPLLPEVRRADIEEGARLAVGGVYHAAAHTLLSESDPSAHVPALRKLLFHALVQTIYLRTGTFAAGRAELLGLVAAEEAALLAGDGDGFFENVLDWASRALRALSASPTARSASASG